MSITSTKGLRTEMEQKFGNKYLLTHRNNQDCLENFYSQVRYRNGPSDHPSPVECLYNIKQIILGKNPGLAKHLKTNTIEREVEEYASATLFKLLSDGDSSEALIDDDDIDRCSDDLNEEYLDYSDDVPEQFLETTSDHMPDELLENDPDDYTRYLTVELRVELLDEGLAESINYFTEEFIADLSTEMTTDVPISITMKEDGLGTMSYILNQKNLLNEFRLYRVHCWMDCLEVQTK